MLNRRKTNGILSSTAIATRKQGQDNQLSLWIMYKYAPCLQEFDLSSFENSLSYVKTCENQGSKNLKNQQNLHSSTAPQLRFVARHPAALGPAPELQAKDRCAVLHAQPPPAQV